MEMVRGNRAMRDHQTHGKELHLFEAIGRGEVRFVGQATYLSHHWEERPDVNGEMRRAVVFELAVETEIGDVAGIAEPGRHYDSGRQLANRPLSELRRLALTKASSSASEVERRSNIYRRSRAIKRYVLKRAAGRCEGCSRAAPFVTSAGRPYLEPHHIRRVADGGPDHPRWVIALCPNCHRRIHHGRDGEAYNARLARRLGKIEGNTDD